MERLLNWIEIPVTDLQRAVKFYSAILQETLQEMEIGPVQYALIPSGDRYNCGALAQGEGYAPNATGTLIYLNGGSDLNSILSRVAEAGGQVLLDKMFLSNEAGYIGMFMDTEGNRIGIQSMQ